MPPGFQFGAPNTDVWIPLRVPESEWRESRTGGYLQVVGRMAPGVTLGEARAEMDTIAANLATAYPEIDARRGVRLTPLRDEFAGSARLTYAVFFAAAAAVLLVACLNVANLLLLRGVRREQELAMRRSLGASRLRLVQQLLAESSLLALVGGGVGLLAGQWTFGFFRSLVPARMAGLTTLEIDAPVMAFTAALAGATALLAGLAPAARLSGLELRRGGWVTGRWGIRSATRRLRSTLVASEVAIAVVLLVSSGLFVGTIVRLNTLEPGFEIENLLVGNIVPRPEVYDEVLERVRRAPGIVSAGVGTAAPLTAYPGRRTVTVDGYGADEPEGRPRALFRTMDPEYLETLGVPVIAGRGLDARDRAGAAPVALINEAMRERYWGGRDAVGSRVKVGAAGSDNPWLTVVGVVGDVRQASLDVEPEPELMLPYAQYSGPLAYLPRTLAVRASGDTTLLGETVRSAIEAADPSVPVTVRTMDQVAASGLEERRLRTVLISGFAGLAFALSVLGVYGLVSVAVADRMPEIGIRMALGAQSPAIVRTIVKDGLIPTGIGCAAGLAAAMALTWTLERFLWGVAPRDPVSFVAATLLVALVSMAASYVPARRIVKIDPLAVLRHE